MSANRTHSIVTCNQDFVCILLMIKLDFYFHFAISLDLFSHMSMNTIDSIVTCNQDFVCILLMITGLCFHFEICVHFFSYLNVDSYVNTTCFD